MGVSRDPFLTPEEAARILAEGKSKTKASQQMAGQSYATDQFFGILHNEPFDLTHRAVDNPEFAWPLKQYTDIAGTTHKVQRGYMRSLITDPNVDVNGLGAKNRRLFFQFNPTVLVRQVQQTPGAMLPLLQSPEQLAQPVPGTATFGFELMFNREHEVNTGDDPLLTESLDLPNDQKGFVSKVGVLADIMVLDLITGQGISQDLLDTLAKRQSNFITQQMDAEDAVFAEAEERIGEEEAKKTYVPTYQETDADQNALKTAFEKQIGNSAFLNPTPFRVMFSSLFMVEGIATSVDVKFTKFSQKMIPVQCTVTINMYALYIGFARKNTFLYDNLVQGSIDTKAQKTKDEEVANKLTAALKQLNFESTKFTQVYYGTKEDSIRIKTNADRTETYKNQIEKKEIKDVNVSIKIQFYLEETNSIVHTFAQKGSWTEYLLTLNDNASIPVSKITSGATLQCFDLSNDLLSERESGTPKKYITFRYEITLTGTGDTGVVVESKPFYTSPQLNLEVVGYTTEDPTDTSPSVEVKNMIADNPNKNKD